MSYTSRPQYTEQEARIRLVSRPIHKSRSFGTTLAMFAFTFVLALVLIGGSLNALFRFQAVQTFASIMLVVGLVVVGYVVVFASRLLSYASKQYILELADDEARLKIIDRRTQRKLMASVLWQDVEYVEFFTPRDTSTLVFHKVNGRLIEVPIWTMTSDASNVLRFLAEKQVPVVRL